MRTVVLLMVVVTSVVGVVALARMAAARLGWSQRAATGAGLLAAFWLWPLGVYMQSGHVDANDPRTGSCLGGSGVVVTDLKRPVVIVRSGVLGGYVRVDASDPAAIRVGRQGGPDVASVNPQTGKARATSTSVMLCDRNGA